ncbi:MAG: dihydrofolate reductase [Candidatus Magasanikbacteria bacterium]|nr:dihydrofolate reductase [Candidatus Magasanikbacteria bacterium]
MSISLIAAVSKNNCIGKNGELPWHIPEDMKHFKEKTMDTVVIMGRKTWESIPEKFRPLKGRKNVVITRQDQYPAPLGVEIHHSLDKALEAHRNEKIAIIGGGQMYDLSIDKANLLYITHVDRVVEGDTFFPDIDKNAWRETERENREGFSFVTYERI